MTIDELRIAIDRLIEQAVGSESSGQINVWVTSRSHRFSFAPEWDVSYSVVVENAESVLAKHISQRLDRESPERLVADFERLILPRVVEWFEVEVTL